MTNAILQMWVRIGVVKENPRGATTIREMSKKVNGNEKAEETKLMPLYIAVGSVESNAMELYEPGSIR